MTGEGFRTFLAILRHLNLGGTPYITVNVEIFAQYTFSHISRGVVDAWK